MKKYVFLALAGLILAACQSAQITTNQSLTVIPYPNHVQWYEGQFNVQGAKVTYTKSIDGYAEAAIEEFANAISAGTHCPVFVNQGCACKGFVFSWNKKLANEEYEIRITKSAVKVKASSLNGFLYAIETLKQMLPVEIYGGAGEGEWFLPCVLIKDAPRFAYRGMHIDTARHFFEKSEILKYLDMMLTHKINTLHWHITDDQGWRIEIEKYPLLTEVGSIRKGTMIGRNWGTDDGIPYGGFYTKDDIREVIEYAASKGITIIPEIDLPGHMQAALTAYPELGCTKGPYEVWKEWGISDDVLCAGNEQTMLFLEDVLDEVSDLFPSELFHIGGDECPYVRWEKCPVCQAKIAELGIEEGEYSPEHYLQSYVMSRMQDFLETKGKRVIGWDEILEGAPAENAIIMSWRGPVGGIKASKLGHDVIMTPNNYFYLDYYQSKDRENEPLGIGGYVPLEKVYSFEPYTEDMDEEAREHIIGVQANLWTEYIAENWHLEYMLLPRQAALSEVQWCSVDNKNWDRFYALMPHETAMYKLRGYTFSSSNLGE